MAQKKTDKFNVRVFRYDFKTFHDWDYIDRHVGDWWNEVAHQVRSTGFIPIVDTEEIHIVSEEDDFILLEFYVEGIEVGKQSTTARYITEDGWISWAGTQRIKSEKS